ncbi:uncharacterized protein SCHCODRAFT_02308760 [Schizophyllum commune H4-8]|uniref:uncharacterized protein n=1 Tax=Schizophyllum commune (strain H4-8 / FGSC 9210) TaxID=578458 RepID=UPI002160FDA1|nr:uncharacterized protein SCHCODRAFT_02308760 [Schizophyllum commune H4-8]KAI5891024.1 hypothetical protein SCHCODRAFT_02308760 [Schizophyllum commune H4-8]
MLDASSSSCSRPQPLALQCHCCHRTGSDSAALCSCLWVSELNFILQIFNVPHSFRDAIRSHDFRWFLTVSPPEPSFVMDNSISHVGAAHGTQTSRVAARVLSRATLTCDSGRLRIVSVESPNTGRPKSCRTHPSFVPGVQLISGNHCHIAEPS